MMREVVDNGNAVHFRAHFEATLHALERLKRCSDLFFRNAVVEASAAAAVAFQTLYSPPRANSKSAPRLAFCSAQTRLCVGSRRKLATRHVAFGRAIAFDRAEGLRDATLDALTGVEGDDASAPRDQIHQTFESGFYGVEIFVDVRVIELHRSENHESGK